MSSSDYIVKPLSTAGFCFVIDQFLFNESDFNKSAMLAASSGAGAYIGMSIGSMLPDLSNTLPTFLGNGKGLMQRVFEVGAGVGISYDVNKFILKNTGYRDNEMNKILTLALADFAGEYTSDYIAGRPLSFIS